MNTDLLNSKKTRLAHIEFTSRCNLRCLFCYASQPGYKGVDLDSTILNDIIRTLQKRKVKVVAVNGHGETTIYPGWHLYCQKLLDQKLPLHIISNFAKQLSEEELTILAQFKSIEISCDTSDPDLFARIRRGAKLGILMDNLKRLKAIQVKMPNQAKISFSCVISDLNVFALPEYVEFALDLGINHFNFCNLTKYPDLENTTNPKHISELESEQLLQAKQSLCQTFSRLQVKQIDYQVQSGLLDTLEAAIQTTGSKMKIPAGGITLAASSDQATIPQQPEKTAFTAKAAHSKRYSVGQAPSQTRDCLDPWNFVLVQSNREILPCCWHRPIYTLSPFQSFEDVFNNFRFRKLRQQLLTGELAEDCRNCPSRGWTSIKQLRRKVRRYLHPLPLAQLLFPFQRVLQRPFVPLRIEYQEGWYPLETDSNIEAKDWQRWRWTNNRAVCSLQNENKPSLLILRGSVYQTSHGSQAIKLFVNDAQLDEFNPGSIHFYKEYPIFEKSPAGKPAVLRIEVNKTFQPKEIEKNSLDTRKLGIQVFELSWGYFK